MQGVSDLTRNLSAADDRPESEKNSCLAKAEEASFMYIRAMKSGNN